MPTSSASAKSVSESPPRTASAARMNSAPRPVLTVRGHGLQDRGVGDLRRRALRRCDRPQLADPVEDDDRVVDRVADDGQQRGQEDAVDRLAQPGEHADEDQHVVHQREHRAGAERPAEPDREVDAAARRARRRARSAPCVRSSSPRLGPISSSRSLVDLAADLARASRIVGLLVVGQLAGAHRDVVVAGAPARRRAGSPASATAARACVDVERRGWCEYSTSRPPVNSTPKFEPADDDAGDGEHDERPRRRPASAGRAASGRGRARSATSRTRPMRGDAR